MSSDSIGSEVVNLVNLDLICFFTSTVRTWGSVANCFEFEMNAYQQREWLGLTSAVIYASPLAHLPSVWCKNIIDLVVVLAV